MADDPAKFVLAKRRNPDAAVRLVCLSWAGGNASTYATWAAAMPDVDVLPIQLPARMNRLREPAIRDLREAARRVFEALDALGALDRPVALFGHSLGGRLAFELGVLIRDAKPAGTLVHLFASGSHPPNQPWTGPPLADLPSEAFVEALRSRGGTPEEVLQSAPMMQLLEPAIRGDFAMLEGYEFDAAAGVLPCPISVLTATDDPGVGDIARWGALTEAGSAAVHEFTGGHFFIAKEPGRGRAQEVVAGALL